MFGSKNICECPNPPGGRAVCEADQLAICRIRDGEVLTECVDPPRRFHDLTRLTLTERNKYVNWALTEITGEERSFGASLDYDDRRILERGSYQNRATGELVTFRFPRALEDVWGIRLPRERHGGSAPGKEAPR